MKNKSSVLVLLAGCFWGLISVFLKGLTEHGLDAITAIFVRMFFAVLSLGLYILIFDRAKFKIKLKDLWCFFGTGIVSLLFFNFCMFSSIAAVGVSVATMLLNTSAIFVIVLSAVFFKEKITLKKTLCLALAMFGFYLLVSISSGQTLNLPGIIFGILSGLGYGLYSIFSRFALNKGYSGETISFYTFVFAVLGSFPFVANAETLHGLLRPGVLLYGLGLGVISCTVPFLLYTIGLKGIDNGKAAILAMSEPIVAVFIGTFLFGEQLDTKKIIGIVIILVAISMLSINFRRRQKG